MARGKIILIAIILVVFVFLASTLMSPILMVAEDSEEDASIDMAASFGLGGFEWVYPGSSFNAAGETLHNVHIDHPDNPYGAAQDIMQHSYGVSPHVIVSINNDAAAAIFGETIVDDIRANDGYFGYGASNVPGTMSRGDAASTAMANNGMNVFEIPLQVLLGNIQFHFV
jgi:hypothetical protein